MRRSAEPEMMDLPGQPRQLLTEDLRNLRLINRYLGWEPGIRLRDGMEKTYRWIYDEMASGSTKKYD